MAAAACTICAKQVPPEAVYRYRRCQCVAHTRCAESVAAAAGDAANLRDCPACLSGTSARSAVGVAAKVAEPHLDDGNDYVKYPGRRTVPTLAGTAKSVAGAVVGAVVNLARTGKPADKERLTALQCLNRKMPIEELFAYGYGLDHILAEGGDMDDFLRNRYRFDDLLHFKDVREGGPRALDAFRRGLGLTAVHLREYPQQFPIQRFRELTGITNAQFCTLLGLEYRSPHESLSCNDGTDYEWDAKTMVQFGLDIDTLRDLGLENWEQYRELMSNMTQAEIRDATRALGITREHLDDFKAKSRALQAERERQARHVSTYYAEEEEAAADEFVANHYGGGGGDDVECYDDDDDEGDNDYVDEPIGDDVPQQQQFPQTGDDVEDVLEEEEEEEEQDEDEDAGATANEEEEEEPEAVPPQSAVAMPALASSPVGMGADDNDDFELEVNPAHVDAAVGARQRRHKHHYRLHRGGGGGVHSHQPGPGQGHRTRAFAPAPAPGIRTGIVGARNTRQQ